MRKVISAVAALVGLVVVTAVAVCFTALGLLSLRSLSPLPPADKRAISLVAPILLNLREQLRHGAALERMQARFPEGACFTLTLYALAWTHLARYPDTPDSVRSTALTEAGWALDQYERPVVVSPFTATQVRNGVLWLGQRNFVLAKLLELLSPTQRPPAWVAEFHANSASMAEAFLASPTAHLDSYPGACWPGDNVPALASLLLHDQMFSTSYRAAYDRWSAWIVAHPDPLTGLPAGRLDSATGRLWEPARGCATSWILALLPAMDPALSDRLYQLYVESFRINRLGFGVFREYPRGVARRGDVDSGPIILGVGTVATGAGLASALANGDLWTAQDIHGLANALGLRRRTPDGGVEYLYGRLPVADAFLAWGYSLTRLQPGGVEALPPPPAARPGRLLFTVIPLLGTFATLATLVLARRWCRLRSDSGR